MISGRAKIRYQESAIRHNLDLAEYLSKGSSGLRYCSVCKKWKKRSNFLEYKYTKNSYIGTCNPCRSGKTAPRDVKKSAWGGTLRASGMLGITPKEYLAKREEGSRWCTDHKGWFDAKDKIEAGGTRIIRCIQCNRDRQKGYRVIRKERNRVSKGLGQSIVEN